MGELDNPARIQALAKRHLQLKPIAPTQFDRSITCRSGRRNSVPPDGADPIGGMIENLEEPETVTGSVPAPSSR